MAAHIVNNATAEILPRYVQLRAVQRELNQTLIKTLLSPIAIEESARRLGFLEGRTILADTEADLDLVQDTVLYDYFPTGGKNAIERYAGRDVDLGADERLVLDAMCRARFTVVELEDRVAEVGVEARDLLFGERFLLADVGLSMTAPRGLVLAKRVLTHDGFSMTSGVHRIFDAGIANLVTGPFASTLGSTGPVLRWCSRERSALARLLLQLTTVEPDEVRHILASYAIASLPKGDPRRQEYARHRARWEDERA